MPAKTRQQFAVEYGISAKTFNKWLKIADYACPYQVAAYLKGATPENGYNPARPHIVEVRVNNRIEQ